MGVLSPVISPVADSCYTAIIVNLGKLCCINSSFPLAPSLPPPFPSSPLAATLCHLLQRSIEEELGLCEGVLEVMNILVESGECGSVWRE